jgi:hypothetical protein
MFVPRIIRRSRNNQQNAQICTTALLYVLATTCFGSSLPSSGSFWIRLSYVKIQIDMVVYDIMWLSGLCVGVSWSSLLCFPVGNHNKQPRHSDTQTTEPHYIINHHIDLYFQVSQTDPEATWKWQTIAETCRSQRIWIKQCCKFVHLYWVFLLVLL